MSANPGAQTGICSAALRSNSLSRRPQPGQVAAMGKCGKGTGSFGALFPRPPPGAGLQLLLRRCSAVPSGCVRRPPGIAPALGPRH